VSYALQLQPENKAFRMDRARVLLLIGRWEEALQEYRLCAGEPDADKSLQLTQELLTISEKERAQAHLYEWLLESEYHREAIAYAQFLGDGFWKKYGEQISAEADGKRAATDLARRKPKMDPSVIRELVKRLEEKLLPVPGTEILMSKTELTVGEWKLYLRAEGYLDAQGQPDWKQPARERFFEKGIQEWVQTDEHPVVGRSWAETKAMCDWLSEKTGQEWRLPTNAEWEAAVGNMKFPWGQYFPPNWDDGNYKTIVDGNKGPKSMQDDGIPFTAPVASFKPNALGFYDLGGNVWEWTWDEVEDKTSGVRVRSARGGGWSSGPTTTQHKDFYSQQGGLNYRGFRLVRRAGP
jgi:hypothetical protein